MTKLKLDISVSLDGYVAGPNPSLDDPLGERGMELHDWIFGLEAWREAHGLEGGDRGADNDMVTAMNANVGAIILGRKMFSGGSGPWEDDPNADGWWGAESPWAYPAFVLTHHARDPVDKGPGRAWSFVTGGIEEALERAREAAAGREVLIGGGAEVARQYLNAGLVQTIQLHIAPVLLGAGTRLLDGVDPGLKLTIADAVHSPTVTHIRYDVA